MSAGPGKGCKPADPRPVSSVSLSDSTLTGLKSRQLGDTVSVEPLIDLFVCVSGGITGCWRISPVWREA